MLMGMRRHRLAIRSDFNRSRYDCGMAVVCTECGYSISPGSVDPCLQCGSGNRTVQMASAKLTLTAHAPEVTISPTKIVIGVEEAPGGSRETRLEARLRAIIAAATELIPEDADPEWALVNSGALSRVKGFLASAERDLGPRTGPGEGGRI